MYAATEENTSRPKWKDGSSKVIWSRLEMIKLDVWLYLETVRMLAKTKTLMRLPLPDDRADEMRNIHRSFVMNQSEISGSLALSHAMNSIF